MYILQQQSIKEHVQKSKISEKIQSKMVRKQNTLREAKRVIIPTENKTRKKQPSVNRIIVYNYHHTHNLSQE